MGEADSTLWVSYWSPVSDTQVRIHSAQQDSPVSKIIFTLFFLFFVGPSPSITDQDCKKTYWVKLTPHCGSAVSHPSLLRKSRSVQHSKTVKLYSHPSPCFLVDQVLASQIKTERRLNV